MVEQESLLARWSRRRQQAVAEEPESHPAETEAEVMLTDKDMPPLDSLTEESEFSGFLSPGVSEELRCLALHKLFHGPVFNVRDGLDDYDDDFTSFVRLGDLITTDMCHRMEQEAKRLAETDVVAPETVVVGDPGDADTEQARSDTAKSVDESGDDMAEESV